MGAAGCLVTLALEQAWQSLTHCVTSLLMQDHITLWLMIFLVAFAPGCAMPWKASNTWRRWPIGITGRGWLPLVSHSTRTVPKGMSWRVRLESPAAWMDGQSRWASAMAA